MASRKEGKSRLGKILDEKSKLNISISKRSRRIHNGANRSGSISVQRQTLRANNRALAKSLQQYKQELNHANNVILELTHERQALQIKYNGLSRVAELKNAEIEKEVQQRLEKKVGHLKELFSMIGHLAGQGIDTFWGEGSSRPSTGMSASRSSLEQDKLDQVSPEALRAALHRSIYSNQSRQEADVMFRGSKPGDLSILIEKSMLDEIGSLPFEETSTSLATVSEIDELKRRSSSMRHSKGRRSNLLDVDSLKKFRASGLKVSGESTPRTSDINQQQGTSLVISDSVEKGGEAILRDSGEQTQDKDASKSPSEMLACNPILDPDERPLDVATGRPTKATFTFIAFENEKPMSPGLGNPVVKKGKSTQPRREVPAKGKSKAKPGSKKSAAVGKRAGNEEVVDPGKKLKLDTKGKPDENAPSEKMEIAASGSLNTEPEESRNDLETGRRETVCVPKEKAPEKETENTAKNRKGAFAVKKPSEIAKKDCVSARRGTFAVTNQDNDLAGNKDIPGSDMQQNDLEMSANDSLGILSTTILEEVDMDFTNCAMDLDLTSLPTIELGNNKSSLKQPKETISPDKDDFPAEIPAAKLGEVVPNELKIDSAVSCQQESLPGEPVLPGSQDTVTSETCKAESSKNDESADDSKKDKKFAVYHLKPGKIQFVAGRKDVNGDFKLPNPMPRSKSRALSRSKSRSRSKQKSQPIELPISNPPSAFDFLGLTPPEKPPAKSVFDISCNESVDGERLSLKEYRGNKGGAIRIAKGKQEDVSSGEEGRMEFSDHKMKKRVSVSAARKSHVKTTEAEGCTSDSKEADESIVVRSRGMRKKKKAVISSSSDTSFADDDSNDEDFAPRLKSKLPMPARADTRRRRETVVIVARSHDNVTAPVTKSSLKSGSGLCQQTLTKAPSASEDEEPKKLNVTFEKPSTEGLENGTNDLEVEPCSQRSKKNDYEAGKLTVSTSGSSCDDDVDVTLTVVNTTFEKPSADEVMNTTFEKPSADEVMNTTFEKPAADEVMNTTFEKPAADEVMNTTFEKPAADEVMNTTFEKPAADEVMNTTFEKPDAVSTTFDKPSVDDSEKVEENCEENRDHIMPKKKKDNRKVAKSKTRSKSKKVEDATSVASCDDELGPPTKKTRSSSVRKTSRRQTAPEVAPPASDKDGTSDMVSITVERASSEDNQPGNQNEAFEKLPGEALEVHCNVNQGATIDETVAEIATSSLDVPAPIDNISFGDISNFWDRKTPAKSKEPVAVETNSRKKTKESGVEKKTNGSKHKELHVGEGSGLGTLVLNENVERKQKNTRKSSKTARGKEVDLDTGRASLVTEIEKVAKNIKKVPRSNKRTKHVTSKSDVTLGGLLNELASSDQEDFDVGGMTMMLEELGDKLDIEAITESPVVKRKKRQTARVALDDVEINSPVPAVTIKKERRSSMRSTTYRHISTSQGQENVNGDVQPAKRVCRNRGAVSYKEPSLNVKMRQGYKSNIIKYDDGKLPDDEECTKKKKKVQKKKKSEVK